VLEHEAKPLLNNEELAVRLPFHDFVEGDAHAEQEAVSLVVGVALGGFFVGIESEDEGILSPVLDAIEDVLDDLIHICLLGGGVGVVLKHDYRHPIRKAKVFDDLRTLFVLVIQFEALLVTQFVQTLRSQPLPQRPCQFHCLSIDLLLVHPNDQEVVKESQILFIGDGGGVILTKDVQERIRFLEGLAMWSLEAIKEVLN